MKLHPICEVWRNILTLYNLNARDVCKAAGINEASFSRYMTGKLWPSRGMAIKINRALEALLGRPKGSVDNLVDKVWTLGGKVNAGLIADAVPYFNPPLIPMVIHRRGGGKSRAGKGGV